MKKKIAVLINTSFNVRGEPIVKHLPMLSNALWEQN